MNLLNKISSVESLRLAWAKLEKFNKESHGLTGETIAEFVFRSVEQPKTTRNTQA